MKPYDFPPAARSHLKRMSSAPARSNNLRKFSADFASYLVEASTAGKETRHMLHW